MVDKNNLNFFARGDGSSLACVCVNCGSLTSEDEILEKKKNNPSYISCCPFRKTKLINLAWTKEKPPKEGRYSYLSKESLMSNDFEHIIINDGICLNRGSVSIGSVDEIDRFWLFLSVVLS